MGNTNSEKEKFEVSSFTYSTPRPFSAQRLEVFINEKKNWRGIHHSDGFFWVGDDHRIAYQWKQIEEKTEFTILGVWIVSVAENKWVRSDGLSLDQGIEWDPVFGDREQRIEFVGEAMDEVKIREDLDSCLLNEKEGIACIESLGTLPSIFPSLILKCDCDF
tara:strand:+ start:1102 stop:1587 length:486 start_codon:yes stop_codon:yes gene_type:complete